MEVARMGKSNLDTEHPGVSWKTYSLNQFCLVKYKENIIHWGFYSHSFAHESHSQTRTNHDDDDCFWYFQSSGFLSSVLFPRPRPLGGDSPSIMGTQRRNLQLVRGSADSVCLRAHRYPHYSPPRPHTRPRTLTTPLHATTRQGFTHACFGLSECIFWDCVKGSLHVRRALHCTDWLPLGQSWNWRCWRAQFFVNERTGGYNILMSGWAETGTTVGCGSVPVSSLAVQV